jgi:hypothetical protein
MSTQIGYIIFLADKHNTCHILKYSSTKSRRIVRSTLGAEAIALATGFDAAFNVDDASRLCADIFQNMACIVIDEEDYISDLR